ERDFAGNEYSLTTAASARALPTETQATSVIGSRQQQCGDDAKYQSGRAGRSQRGREHAAIDVDVAQTTDPPRRHSHPQLPPEFGDDGSMFRSSRAVSSVAASSETVRLSRPTTRNA